MAVNLAENYKPPHLVNLVRVNQVTRESGCLGMAGLQLKFQRKVSFTLIFSSMKIID